MCKSPTEYKRFFWQASQASATVEFAFVFPIIVLLGLMLIDFTFHFSAESKLARLSNSMSSMLRERSTLYANNLVVASEDVKNLQKTVDLLLGSDALKGTVSVRVQTVHFSDTSTKTSKILMPQSREIFMRLPIVARWRNKNVKGHLISTVLRFTRCHPG